MPVIHEFPYGMTELPRSFLVYVQHPRHHHWRDAFGGRQYEEDRRDPDAQVKFRRVERRLGGNGELLSALPFSALIQAGSNGGATKRPRAQAAAVWAETIIAPDRSLQKKPRMVLRRHLFPDVAEGFEFCDHARASFLQGTEDIGCFLKIRSDYVLARSRAR